MKKCLHILFFFIIACRLIGQELALDSVAIREMAKLSLVTRTNLVACVREYTTFSKNQPLDLDYAFNTCECVALDLNFSKTQQEQLTQLLQDSTAALAAKVDGINSLNVLRNKIILLLSDKVTEYGKKDTKNEATSAEPTQGQKNPSDSASSDDQFKTLLGIIGFVAALFATLLFLLWRKINPKATSKTESAPGSTKLEYLESADRIASIEKKLKEQEEYIILSVDNHSQRLLTVEESIAQLKQGPAASIGNTGVNNLSEAEAKIVTVIQPKVESTSKQTIVYAQQPLNGLFIKWTEQFTPKQTFFQIEINPQRQDIGDFTLVNDADTQQVAFNIPDTYLPSAACEIRSSGGPLNTQRKWNIVSKGSVERQGGVWRITKPMIMQFD